MKKNKHNAVVFKEMTVDMKKPKVMLVMLLANLGLTFIAIAFFGFDLFAITMGEGTYRIIAWYFIVMVFMEFFVIMFVTPAITAGSVSLEKERQTLDVLLTTRLTPWEIIKGKFLSNFVFLASLVVSTFPLLSLIFIYGGVSLWSLLWVGLSMIVVIAFIESIGIFWSAITKNTILSVILSYLSMFFQVFFTAIIPTMLIIFVEMINLLLYEDIIQLPYNLQITNQHLLNGDYFILIALLNPVALIFDTVGNAIGYTFGETSFTGMVSLADTLTHMTEKNIFLLGWSPLSMVLIILLTFGILKLSAAFLNPLRGRKKKVKNKR